MEAQSERLEARLRAVESERGDAAAVLSERLEEARRGEAAERQRSEAADIALREEAQEIVFRRASGDLGRPRLLTAGTSVFRPNLARRRPNLAGLRANSARHQPDSVRLGPESTDIPWTRRNLNQCRPTLA